MATLTPAGPHFGAKGGYPRDPGWVHNLRAHPDATIRVGSEQLAVRAREPVGDERVRLWNEAVAYNPLWGDYQRRTHRNIPLIVLQRAAEHGDERRDRS